MIKLHLSKIGIKTALYVGIVGISLALIQSAVLTYFDVKKDVEQTKTATATMLESSSATASNIVFEMNERAAEKLINGLLLFDYIAMGSITDELGNTIVKAEKAEFSSNISNSVVRLLNIKDETIILPLVNPRTNEPDFGSLSVRISTAILIEPILINAKFSFLIGILYSCIIIIFLWLIVYFYITNPLKTLQEGVKNIGTGHLEKPIPIDRKDELGDLATSVNKMANQLKETFDDLKISEMKYRDLVENINDVIFTVNERGEITYISQAIETVSGYRMNEIVGKKFSDFIYKDDLPMVSANFKKVLTGQVIPYEYRIIKKTGEISWVRSSSRQINENGLATGIRGVLVDIDKTKGLEIQLQQIQKLESIGTLAGGIAHDFNNILSSIFGYAELAQMDAANRESVEKNLDEVLNAATRAKNLVRHILTFSRQSDIQKNPTAIHPLIKETLKFIKSTIPSIIEIKYVAQDSGLMVLADPTQIHQIIMNLCTNAAHAMKEKGGILDVHLGEVEIIDEATLQYKDLKKGKYLHLTVADTGIGIDKAIINKIFDPFFTTKEQGEGTGLGLSVIHGIVTEMEGSISLYSEKGKGTVFKILLPRFEEAASEAAVEEKKIIKGEGKILFVDDEKPIIETGKRILDKLGYDVTPTMSGMDALEIFRADPDSFDLVLTDMTMPKITGLELSRRVKAIRPNIPVILCTGYAPGLTGSMIREHGIRKLIMKPIISSELAAVINEVLGGEVSMV